MTDTSTTAADKCRISRIVQGFWKLAGWELPVQELAAHIRALHDIGIDTYDHADIYGDYTCEQIFGEALSLLPGLRSHSRLISKCGIKLLSGKYPDRQIKSYDYSAGHIISSVEQSLRNFRTDYLDLLLLHRPAPFFNPEEVARAFSSLKRDGKVLYFGVSNFNASQFEMLEAYIDVDLITNQVEISPYSIDQFEQGQIDFLLKKKLRPMAWSPLANGKIWDPDDQKALRILAVLQEIADELGGIAVDTVIYAWLLTHPAGIIPVIGTKRIDRALCALNAIENPLTQEQWYRIYTASTGRELP